MRITDLGFVPIEEIGHVFSTTLSKIEEDMKKNGVPTDPRSIIEYVDEIRMLLNTRAKYNIEQYLKENPHVKRQVREEKQTEETPKTATAGREERIKANKQAAIQEALKG